jgi:hypothetical protein
MFNHIKGKPLTIKELKVADRLVANGLEPGWVTREIIATAIRDEKKVQLAKKQ